ncbi:MAG TPA: NUDIX hydrolase [Phycisphaerae bacterium]|nr:NUDIX hydrolase [Phycisphaerae bacterium]
MGEVVKTRKFSVIRTEIPTADGGAREFEYIRHGGAAVVLPLLSENELLMIRNHRPAIGRELWELPAGTLDKPCESPQDAAGRELEEETGYRSSDLTLLCEFYPSPGFLTEKLFAFVARNLVQTQQKLEPTERITVHRMSCDEAVQMAYDGRIEDAKTLIVLMRYDHLRRTNG